MRRPGPRRRRAIGRPSYLHPVRRSAALVRVAQPLHGDRPAVPRRRYGADELGTIIDTNFARLLDGGQLAVRYGTADVPMAACRSAANQNAFAGVVLKSNIFSGVAHIDLRCGGGHGSVMFGFAAEAEGHFQLFAKRR